MIKKHWLYPKKRPPMPVTAAAIDREAVRELCYVIRRSDMSNSAKYLNIENLLKAVDIIRRCEIDRLVSVTQAAELRGVTRQTVWKMLKSGTLTPFKVAGYTVVDRDELLGLPPKGELRMTTVRFKHMRKARKS